MTDMDDMTDGDFYFLLCVACKRISRRGRVCARCGTRNQDRSFMPDVVEAEVWFDDLAGSAILEHIPDEEAFSQVTIECLADYLMARGTSRCSQWLWSVPSDEERKSIGDVAFAVIEDFEDGRTVPDQVKQALSEKAGRLFLPDEASLSPLFHGLVSGTAHAFVASANVETEVKAVRVMLVGCTLLQKAQVWSRLREQDL